VLDANVELVADVPAVVHAPPLTDIKTVIKDVLPDFAQYVIEPTVFNVGVIMYEASVELEANAHP
jgi:hypothetical protein